MRRGYYRSNNFYESTKITEIKTLGYLPRVLFFNVFELDAKKNMHQVFSSGGALRSMPEVFSIRIFILSI